MKHRQKKKSNDKISFRKLSREDQEFVKEMGHLPDKYADDEVELTGRVYDEREFDEVDRNDRKRPKMEPVVAENNFASDEEEIVLTPYQILLESLKKDGKITQDAWSDQEEEAEEMDDELLEEESDEISEEESAAEIDENGDPEFEEEELEFEIATEDEAEEGEDEDEDHLESSEEEQEIEQADSKDNESEDPFFYHFSEDKSHELTNLISRVKTRQVTTTVFEDPDLFTVSAQTFDQSQMKAFAKTSIDDLPIKKRILDGLESRETALTSLQLKLLSQMSLYKDITMTTRTFENGPDVIEAYAIHILNHVMKSGDRLVKNNEKVKRSVGDDNVELRDQGFTRPRALILLPFRNIAYQVIQKLIELSNTEQQENKKRFDDDFGGDDTPVDEKKPEDYQQLFQGNFDDCFRIGIKVSRKSMKLYNEFYSSDIIIASPLGLRMIIGAEGDKKRDFDFLSSIEVVVADMMNVMLMQNWDHVQHIFKHLNLIPKESHGCDFSRVRNWYLDGNAKYLRQNIFISSFNTPELNALAKNKCLNVAGRIKNKQESAGSITKVILRLQHIFNRVDCSSFSTADDTRFKVFTEKMFPAFTSSTSLHHQTCIVIPSFFDFLRLKKWFTEKELSFTSLSEYATGAEISGARSSFFNGHKHFLLITERFHFFRRYRLRGIKNLIFYGPPIYPQFYTEFVNMIGNSKDSIESLSDESTATVAMLYTKYDCLSVERIVGSKRVERLISGDKSVYMFA